jgi:transposase
MNGMIEKENILLKTQLQERDDLIEQLREKVRLLELLHFGSKSEKLTSEDKKQEALFNEAEDSAFDQQDEESKQAVIETIEIGAYKKSVKKNAGRKAISEDLPREVIYYDIPEEDKICACGTEKICIGEDVSERAKIIPAEIVVLQERRKKYACKNCEGTTLDEKGIQTAEGIKHLIDGSIADESLLAWSIHEKFEFALPFYRQSKRLAQIGIPIPRATLSNLAIKSAQACKPVYELIKKNIQEGSIINADETRVQVLKEPGRAAKDQSWMWIFLGGEPERRSVVFQYDESRSHQIPYDFLNGYSGWLQTDDYGAYHTALRKIHSERVSNDVIRHVLCWAHVRRGFYKYWKVSKDEEAKKVLESIKKIFKLEDLRNDYSLKGFAKQRKNRAEPMMEKLKKDLIKLYKQVPPSLGFGKAINYTLDNWEQLVLYLENPLLTPSNNIAENAIRPFVIGRKNWLFAGSPKGAESSAILYSLVESAKLNELSVYDYFHYILKKLPYCRTPEDYEVLLPYNLTPETIKI